MNTAIRLDHVAIYIRWSTDDQGSGTTLEVQRDSCAHYVQSQGWWVNEELTFIDDGYSGGNLDRPAMHRLRQRVQMGDVDCVVMMRIDRLSRNIVDAVDLVLNEWQEEGRCHIKSVTEPVDTTTDLGRMIFGLLAMFADFERSSITSRTQGGKERQIRAGRQLHGQPAFGYIRDPDRKGVWLENPQEAPLVHRLFQLAASGVSANAICRLLNDEGARTRAGKEWSVRGVLWILHNRTYLGEAAYGRTSLKAVRTARAAAASAPGTLASRSTTRKRVRVVNEQPKFEGKTDAVMPLIDVETFEVVQERLRVNQWQRHTMGSRAMSSPYLLTGLVQCPCDGALVHKVQMGKRNRERGKEYRHYICHKSRSGTCKTNGHIPADAAERIVESLFFELFALKSQREERFAPAIAEATADRKAVAASLETAQGELNRLAEEERRILRETRSGKVSFDDLRVLRESIEHDRRDAAARITRLQERLQELDIQTRSLATTLGALGEIDRWDALEAWQKRQLLRMVLRERITLHKPKGSTDIAVDIPWAF